MSIDAKTVTHIAKLARIRLSEDEVASYTRELSAILDWVEQLSEVQDDGTEAVASVVEHPLPMRADVATETSADEVLRNAPSQEYGCYVVPKVIDQG